MLRKKNRWISTLLISLGLSTPLIAQATDLTITNNTDYPSTSIINGGLCSNVLPGGVTQPHSTNVVGEGIVKGACWFHPDNCTADIFITDNCTGTKIGQVIISTTTGIKHITVEGPYSIQGSGFTITLG